MADLDTGYASNSHASRGRPTATHLEVAAHPWAMAGLGFLGGLLGALGVKALVTKHLFFTGDEPPVRVRSGSLKLDLLRRNAEWTDAPPFGVKTDPSRGRDELVVVFLDPEAKFGTDPAPRVVEALQVFLIDANKRRHRVQSNEKRIRVTPHGQPPPSDAGDGHDVLKLSTAPLEAVEIVTGGGQPTRYTVGASMGNKLLIMDW